MGFDKVCPRKITGNENSETGKGQELTGKNDVRAIWWHWAAFAGGQRALTSREFGGSLAGETRFCCATAGDMGFGTGASIQMPILQNRHRRNRLCCQYVP
jgi:hypothetical protein